ncbi:MAG: threonine/serine exporter family protein [Ruminococcaceae bacterium]|nr:threonine/serine exporter family protein [Oscillospiraceae bacterium]
MNDNLESTDELNHIDSDRLLRLSLDMGEGMLKSGAEIHRVEECIRRICLAYGVAHVEVFAITSLIVASVRLSNGDMSLQMRRVYNSSNNLMRVEKLNDISRTVCKNLPSLDEFEKMILNAKKETQSHWILQYLGGVLVAGSFAILFGGSILDALVAALMGMIVIFIDNLPVKNLDSTVKCVVTSFICGLLTCVFVNFGIGHDQNIIMIGTIMLLIPGIAFGNSLSDLVYGDILAGVSRLVQSLIKAVLIAVAFGLAIFTAGVLL